MYFSGTRYTKVSEDLVFSLLTKNYRFVYNCILKAKVFVKSKLPVE